MILRKRNLIHVSTAAAALSLGLVAAHAQLIDVNFYNSGYGVGAPATGPAVVGNAGDIWNGVDAQSSSGGPLGLVNTLGGATPVTVSYDTSGGGALPAALLNTQPNPSLMNSYLFNNQSGTITVTLAGLTPFATYGPYVYVASDDAFLFPRSADLNVNGLTGGALGAPAPAFVSGANYLHFNPVANADGNIVIVESDDISNTGGEVDFNGLQLLAPDQSTTLGLFAMSGLGLALFARRNSKKSAV
jgi:hypothetical protein